jgi:enoyl-CoA hydratase
VVATSSPIVEDARIGLCPRACGAIRRRRRLYRLGPEKAKRMLFAGDQIEGREKLELMLKRCPLKHSTGRWRRPPTASLR